MGNPTLLFSPAFVSKMSPYASYDSSSSTAPPASSSTEEKKSKGKGKGKGKGKMSAKEKRRAKENKTLGDIRAKSERPTVAVEDRPEAEAAEAKKKKSWKMPTIVTHSDKGTTLFCGTSGKDWGIILCLFLFFYIFLAAFFILALTVYYALSDYNSSI